MGTGHCGNLCRKRRSCHWEIRRAFCAKNMPPRRKPFAFGLTELQTLITAGGSIFSATLCRLPEIAAATCEMADLESFARGIAGHSCVADSESGIAILNANYGQKKT